MATGPTATVASMVSRRPNIEVIAHGPYEVTGDVSLNPRRVVRSNQDEPIAWKTEEALPHPTTYYLCRCGQSGNKPFCDGTHAFELFDGTETASVTTSAERAELHEGPGIVVHKDGELCHHAQFCKQDLPNWFELVPQTSSTSALIQLIAMIERCPSGALAYELDGTEVEPNLPVEISPISNGPLFVSGGIPVERSDGEPSECQNRLSLCRCGKSANKPLCDGTHIDIGFEA
jgi:CDGSH-type Zn-finger protein